jgi:hypothetical protein
MHFSNPNTCAIIITIQQSQDRSHPLSSTTIPDRSLLTITDKKGAMTNINWQKRTIAAFTLTLSTIGLPSIAQAATLTFDDLSSPGPYMGSYKDMPSNYAGFTWNDFSYDSTPPEYTGYINGVVSPTTILFNTAARPAAFSRPQTFDFTRAYLTAAWSNGLNILVEGFFGTTQTYSRTVTVNTDRPTLFNFDFLGVDRVLFTSSEGVDAATLG